MKIFLRRHAQTHGNLLRQYLGRTNEALCPEGIAEAQVLPADAGVARVYVSGLRRTAETARILYPVAHLVPVPELNEMDFGRFEGHTWEELKHDDAYRAWLDSDQALPCPGGEGKAAFIARCCAAFTEILRDETRRGASAVHFVVHGGTIMAVMSRLAVPRMDYFDCCPSFCHGWALDYADANSPKPLAVIEKI